MSNHRLSTSSGSPVCDPDQSPVRVSRLIHPIRSEWTPAKGGLYLDRTLVLVVLTKISEYSEYCLVVVLLLSIFSSLDPPEFNPGHGHQIVANIQEEDSKEKLWITVQSFIRPPPHH